MAVRDELSGRTLGEFVLRERIGEGAFGAVYRCEQPLLGREAVVKVLHGRLRASQIMVQRFLREARLASRLDHPYAAHVYAFGLEKEDGLLWIAMEMVHGTPLDRWLRERGALPLAELVPFFERIAEVAQTAHERGIVHRDLKPSNVMVIERAGRLLPKLLDFGIAKMLYEDDPADGPQLPAWEPPEPVAAPPLPERTLPSSTGTLTATAEAVDLHTPLAGELTAVGAAIGSPPYMAPEQWSGDAVGPRADLYALGVLAYEALTGRKPFQATSMAGFADLHAHQPVPPLGEAHPPALDRFFARALAKRPADRPGSALELAAALRVAAGLAEDPVELPRLERALHDAWVADAPQPLAEAVAALEGARNAHQARDAARELFRTLVRYLLALALASRAQVREARIDPVAEGLLRELGRRSLDDSERVRLMRQLMRALADHRGAYPIPPLVDLLVPGEGQDDLLEPMLRLDPTTEPRGAGDDLVRSLVAQLVLALGRLLRAAAFVLDYQLVAARGGASESWMGLRRARRRIAAVRGPAPPERQPVLLDPGGGCALVLWPLAQLAPPTPGADAELFLFDGPDRRGARLIAAPLGFERHDPALWDWLGEHAFARSTENAATRTEEAPYLGLAPFSSRDADRFVGRERDVDALSNRLRTTAFQVVVGASGAGKSSFVHAGLVPALPPGTRVVTMRPGSRPIATLASKLAAAGIAPGETRALFDAVSGAAAASGSAGVSGAAAALGTAAARIAGAAGDGLIVIVIDQLEELFTLCRDEAARDQLAVIVDALAAAPDGRIRVIGTLRDDFLMRATGLPVLGPRIAASVFFLGNPSREDLIRTIQEPARRAGYELSDAELAPQMADSVIGRPGALALLSFTASRLWELRDRQFRRLTRRAYEAMGGVGGALGQHAEETIAALGAEDRRLVRDAFRHLVTAEGTRAQLSVADLGQVLASPSAGAVIDKLVDARLLVIAEHEDGARIEIIHEALLGAWPRVREWIREDADSARMRDQVRSAARQWDERGQPRGLLWRDEALAELERWRSRHEAQGLTETERAFADESRAAAVRGRRRRRRALGAAFAVLGVALAVMYWLRGEATHQGELAEKRAAEARRQGELADQRAAEVQAQLVRNYVERGQQALLAGNMADALKWLGEAYGQGDRTPALRFMQARAKEAKAGELVTLDGGAGRVMYAAFSPDGKRVVTAGQDTAAHVWDAATGRELFTLRGHKAPVVVAWSPRGELATGDAVGKLRLWTGDGLPIAPIWAPAPVRGEPEGGPAGPRDTAVSVLVFSRDGARVAVGRSDGTVTIGDPRRGELAAWRAAPTAIDALAFDPAGQRVVTSAGESGKVVIWSTDGRALHPLVGHTESVWQVMFDATGERVITASLDRIARVWDARTGRLLHRMVGHEDRLTNLAIDDRARRLATGSRDTTVRIWNLDTGEVLATLRGHTGQVTGMIFAPGEQIVTASNDGTARVWDLTRGVETAVYFHGGFLSRMAIDPAGARLVTASWSGTAKIWDLHRQSRLSTYTSPGAVGGDARLIRTEVRAGRLVHLGARGIEAWELASGKSWSWRQSEPRVVAGGLSPDGRTTVAVDAAGTLHVLDAAGHPLRELPVGGVGVSSVAVYPGGRRAAICGHGGEVTVWDLATGSRVAARSLGAVNEIRLSEDGRVLVAFELDSRLGGKGAAWLLDGDLGHEIRLDHATALLNTMLSPDGSRLAALGQDGGARIWTRDGRLEATLPHPGPVGVAAWSSDGSWLATGTYGGLLTIWSRAGWQTRKIIEAHANFISALTIGDHDEFIGSAGGDGIVKLWDTAQLLQVTRIASGSGSGSIVSALAIERDQLLVLGPLGTQSWRSDR